MDTRRVWQGIVLALLAVSAAGCSAGGDCLNVAEVWRNADSLAGKQICVRGRPHFSFTPFHPQMRGGCLPGGNNARIGGKLELLDVGSPDPAPRLSVPDLRCQGDQCVVECRPFAAPCTEYHDSPCDNAQAFELVGTLRVDKQQAEVELSLDNLDLSASRRSAGDRWESIPTGVFKTQFP
jgi:hypothetical protein